MTVYGNWCWKGHPPKCQCGGHRIGMTEAEYVAHIKKIVDEAPPLSAATMDKVRVLFGFSNPTKVAVKPAPTPRRGWFPPIQELKCHLSVASLKHALASLNQDQQPKMDVHPFVEEAKPHLR